MVQFLNIPQQPSYAERIAAGFGGGLSEGIADSLAQFHKQQENKQQLSGLAPLFKDLGMEEEGIQKILGSGLDPQLVANIGLGLGKQKAVQEKEARQQKEKLEPIKAALDTVARQRQILSTGKLGPKAGGFGQAPKALEAMTKKGQKLRSEYERLGKSLIQMSSNIPIRNRQEFETLAHGLFDPTLNEAEIEGNLDAMERIIKNSLRAFGGGETEEGLQKDSEDFVLMKDPQGTVRRIPKDQAMSAQKAGGKLVQ